MKLGDVRWEYQSFNNNLFISIFMGLIFTIILFSPSFSLKREKRGAYGVDREIKKVTTVLTAIVMDTSAFCYTQLCFIVMNMVANVSKVYSHRFSIEICGR